MFEIARDRAHDKPNRDSREGRHVKHRMRNFGRSVESSTDIMENVSICTVNRIYCVSGLLLCTLGIVINIYICPFLIQRQIVKKISLKEGWPARETWSKLSFHHEFHAYIFNISNADEVLQGAKPILQEFGPYVYDIWQEKINIEDHDDDDTLSYTLKKTFYFNVKKSNGLSENDEFTLIHYMFLGIANGVLRSQPTVLPLVSRSIDSLYNKPKSIFNKVNVRKYLFEGYELDCRGVEEFFGKTVCNDVKEKWFQYRFEKIEEDLYSTSAWGTFNNTVDWNARVRINRGIKNVKEIGKVVEINNVSNFNVWKDEKCDEILGTDGSMFRPFLNKQDDLHIVNTYLKRNFHYQYDSSVHHDRLPLYRYTATVGTDLETNPADNCYCIAPDRCLKNGVFEIWKAMNWALIVSNPHFYLADPYYTERVDGLMPQKAKHTSTIDVHPLTGTIVHANFRIQYNAPLTRQPKYRLLKNVSEAFLPVGWIEEKFILPDHDVNSLKSFQITVEMEKYFSYGMIVVGLIFFLIGIAFGFMERNKTNAFL